LLGYIDFSFLLLLLIHEWQTLMGGGGSFSSGGPGKGMHSRLCKFELLMIASTVVGFLYFTL